MVAQNRGSVVLFWVPTLNEAVPPPPPRGRHCSGFPHPGLVLLLNTHYYNTSYFLMYVETYLEGGGGVESRGSRMNGFILFVQMPVVFEKWKSPGNWGNMSKIIFIIMNR